MPMPSSPFPGLCVLFALSLGLAGCPGDPGKADSGEEPTCSDWIRNGDETGVDCGGSCQACPECATAEECPGADGECQVRTCTAGVCGVSFTVEGTPIAAQTAGDCQRAVCNGAGGVTQVAFDTDLPDDGNECTTGACTGGAPTHPPRAASTACSQNGGALCDGSGACVQCVAAFDCQGEDTECAVRTCIEGVCGTSFTSAGTPVSAQSPGDCQRNECDGAGAVAAFAHDADLPDDGNQCTQDLCTDGVPGHLPVAASTSCSENGGSMCDGSGVCVQCVAASDCQGQDTECQARTCTAGACGTSFTGAGTQVSTQAAGDCQSKQCDGAGAVVQVADDTDLPDDGNVCTQNLCTAGVPSHPPVAERSPCSQNGGSMCDGSVCVQCLAVSDCSGQDTECQARTCTAGACGTSFTGAGTPVSTQAAGDCQSKQCDGAGAVVQVADDTDLPNDGNVCTQDLCTAGVPSHPPVAASTPCSDNGGTMCDSTGACVACLTASHCPGSDTECQERTCSDGSCGTSFASAGTPVSAQSAGDCQRNECDGAGAVASSVDDTDLPDDGNVCTQNLCSGGVPSHPPVAASTPCSDNGGTMCDSTGVCVGCVAASNCPGEDTECQERTCSDGSCGTSFVSAGTPVSTQSAGDCQRNVCDGAGAVDQIAHDTDLPDDGNACTQGQCASGVPSHPPVAASTPCSQSGGQVCDGAGVCVECTGDSQCGGGTCTSGTCAPGIVATSPADGASGVPVGTAIAITFSHAMDPTTLVAATTRGPCTGSVQVSHDNFASCIGFAAEAPSMSNGDTVATLSPLPALAFDVPYKVRVTTAATSAAGAALAAAFTTANGFWTVAPAACAGTVVISQLYGAGGNAGAVLTHDFVELHNTGKVPATLDGWSIQYASSAGTSWGVAKLHGTVAPGGFYLLQLGSGGAVGASMPTPDAAVGAVNMGAAAGKVALVAGTAPLTGSCLTTSPVVDFVGFGTTANCFEGVGPTPAPSAANAIHRDVSGCHDSQNNQSDFLAAPPVPRNTASAPAHCSCPTDDVLNESDTPAEADFCKLQFPSTLAVTRGQQTPPVYGRLYEAGVTEAAGPPPGVRAELGYARVGTDLFTSRWAWFPTLYNLQVGNDDEYEGSFLAPIVAVSSTYSYAYRFSFDGGSSWTYCDLDGAGSAPGVSYSDAQLGTMTVNP